MKKITLLVSSTILVTNLFGQLATDKDVEGKTGSRYIQTAVPFMTIAPDARAASLADAGVATSADANSMHWNAAKLTEIKDADGQEADFGLGLTHTPWLAKLINDMSLNYLTGYKRISKTEVIGASLNYFNLGEMTFRNGPGAEGITGTKKPYELTFGVAYARKLSTPLSISLGLKLIHSNLASGITLSNNDVAKAGNSVAADLGVYYNKDITVAGEKLNLALGSSISNLGNKLTYTTREQAYFIPTNFRVGTAITKEIDLYNKITLIVDFNKLMVPTPAVYSDSLDKNNNPVLIDGKEAKDKSLISGVLGSFADAPGGFKEEMQEFTTSIAVEYWYTGAFSARAGYFNESEVKGNRKFFTLGAGVRYQQFGFDFAYLIPIKQNNPLADTIRISLLMNLKSKNSKEASSVSE